MDRLVSLVIYILLVARLTTSFVPFSPRTRNIARAWSALSQALDDDTNAEDASSISKEKSPSFPLTKWNVDSEEDGFDYRLYVDIGREEGTWMDPRWGASGNRIEFTLDVRLTRQEADQALSDAMVQDNFGGKSSPVYRVETATHARLRRGFDEMKCSTGAYRIDESKTSTIRFFVEVSGKESRDVSIPTGYLYFSLPIFGDVNRLSTKEGPVTVRQMGWHTGWRRMESRIVGVFRAASLADARKKDRF